MIKIKKHKNNYIDIYINILKDSIKKLALSIKNRNSMVYIDKNVDTVLSLLYKSTVNEFAVEICSDNSNELGLDGYCTIFERDNYLFTNFMFIVIAIIGGYYFLRKFIIPL